MIVHQPALSQMFLDELESYKKKNYEVNAKGVEKWMLEKLGKAFEKKCRLCGDDSFADLRKRREAEEKPKRNKKNKDGKKKQKNAEEATTEQPTTTTTTTTTTSTTTTTADESICHTFRDLMQPVLDWTKKNMKTCSYESKNNGKKENAGGCKYEKKWAKIVHAFHHGAKNQPKGALCEEEENFDFGDFTKIPNCKK